MFICLFVTYIVLVNTCLKTWSIFQLSGHVSLYYMSILLIGSRYDAFIGYNSHKYLLHWSLYRWTFVDTHLRSEIYFFPIFWDFYNKYLIREVGFYLKLHFV